MSQKSPRGRRWRRQRSTPVSKNRFSRTSFERLEDRHLLTTLAFLQPDGTLRLNVGTNVGPSDPNFRQIAITTINEDYLVEHVSGLPTDPGGETVKVTAFATTETYSGVKAIFAEAGTGDDSINLFDTLAPSELHGGDGNDQLFSGHGAASLFGDANDDFLTVGSGDLNLQGHVTVSGGSGTDHIAVNDSGSVATPNTLLVDYNVTPTSVTSTNSADAPGTQVARTFGGVDFDNTVESLRLDATDGRNTIVVHPSLDTQFYIDGNKPTSGTVNASKGDSLQLDTTGTTGRKLTSTGLGAGQWTFTSAHKAVQFENIEQFNHVNWIAVGSDVGSKGKSQPRVQVFDAETNELLFEIDPSKTYGTTNFYGIHVAMGDLDGDGIPDVVVAPGRNTAPDIKVFAGVPLAGVQGTSLGGIGSNLTYGGAFKGGVNVVVADVTGDDRPDIILAPTLGVATIKVFRTDATANGGANFTQVSSFNAFADIKGYIGGASIAAADFDGAVGTNGVKYSELVVGTGAGVKARWRIFNVQGAAPINVRTVFDPTGFKNGINVAAGDVDNDGIAEVVTATGSGGNSWIRVYRATGAAINSFRAFTLATDKPNVAVHIAMYDTNGDGRDEIFATQGQDGRSQYQIKRFTALTGALIDSYIASSSDFFGGGLNIG